MKPLPLLFVFLHLERLRDQFRRTRSGAVYVADRPGLAGGCASHSGGAARPVHSGLQSVWDERRDLYRDPRATRVGDPVTVTISMNDKATLDNKTDRSRDSQTKFGADYLVDMFWLVDQGAGRRKRQLAVFDEGCGENRPDGRSQVFRRRGRGRCAAERQFADQRLAGSAGELRDARSQRRRHRQAAGYRSQQHDLLRQGRRSANFLWWSRSADGGAATRPGASRSTTRSVRSRWRCPATHRDTAEREKGITHAMDGRVVFAHGRVRRRGRPFEPASVIHGPTNRGQSEGSPGTAGRVGIQCRAPGLRKISPVVTNLAAPAGDLGPDGGFGRHRSVE